MVERIDVVPGATLLRRWLSIGEQRVLAAECLALGRGSVGFYTPVARGGRPMSVQMLCLGRHWNALTYRYEGVRSDVDAKPVPALPASLAETARRTAREAGFELSPDTCIVNWYGVDSRLGLHQDKDESPETLAAGVPVVSLSLGDAARFLLGGTRRREPVQSILLESGDAFVFGGSARLRYHGVARIFPGTGPSDLGIEGRLNLTFRQY